MPRATESATMPWLRRLGVATPELVVVTDERELAPHASAFGPPWVVKPDIAGSGKGLAGLVHVCRSRDELAAAVAATLRSGAPALVAEYVEGAECYLSVALDEVSYGAVVRASVTGGVGFDARQAAAVRVRLSEGLHDREVVTLLNQADVKDRRLRRALAHALRILWAAFCAAEAVLVEVNPFRWDARRLVAVGAAVEFDPHGRAAARALRPAVLVEPGTTPHRAPTPREIAVREADAAEPHRPGVTFFELDGDVAYLVSGGGAGLVGLDYLYDNGVLPACYLDASPGAGSAKVQALFRSALSVPGIRGALFGAAVLNLVDARELAQEFIEAAEAAGFDAGHVPTVVRLAGPYEAEARGMLKARLPGALVLDREASLEDACDLLISAMGRAPRAWEGSAR
ncbi:ATP-grasp domain-containing protein [Streptacidiphilus sp. MAP5-3]|uniref:ATP-grasp domain-containing protein n=1 Tax=unclassified Streptacidiphilus TaxID=2643834 RepID=UPI0035181DDC